MLNQAAFDALLKFDSASNEVLFSFIRDNPDCNSIDLLESAQRLLSEASYREPNLKEREARRRMAELFRYLHAQGLAVFKVGRHGRASRLLMPKPLRDALAQLARGEPTTSQPEREPLFPLPAGELQEARPEPKLAEAAAAVPAGPPEMIRHSFVLRKDLSVSFELPMDLTRAEAARLSRFVAALPLEGPADP